MPTWAKVLIISGVVLALLVVALAGFGVYLWKQNGPQLIESSKKAMVEGREFGKETDNQTCLNDGVARHKKAEGFGALIAANLFLGGCLDTRRPTPGFCDGVPTQTEFIKSAQWQLQQCTRYGLSSQKQCGQLFVQMQNYCQAHTEHPTTTETK